MNAIPAQTFMAREALRILHNRIATAAHPDCTVLPDDVVPEHHLSIPFDPESDTAFREAAHTLAEAVAARGIRAFRRAEPGPKATVATSGPLSLRCVIDWNLVHQHAFGYFAIQGSCV